MYLVQILVQSHLELVSSVLALEATEPVSELVTQMAVELINTLCGTGYQKRTPQILRVTHFYDLLM